MTESFLIFFTIIGLGVLLCGTIALIVKNKERILRIKDRIEDFYLVTVGVLFALLVLLSGAWNVFLVGHKFLVDQGGTIGAVGIALMLCSVVVALMVLAVLCFGVCAALKSIQRRWLS